MATIGMMDSAFFVGRQEILNWLNSFLQLQYLKIEDTANGAASCQLMDALHPGSVNLSRVDYQAQREFECLQNYQVLQEAFQKVGIEKTIPVNDLCRAKYRDNLEWMQWMKRYFGIHWSDSAQYDAKQRRKDSKCFYFGDNPAPAPAKAPSNPSTLGARVSAARLPASSSAASVLATPQRAQNQSRTAPVTQNVPMTQPRAPRPSLPANSRPITSTHTSPNSNSPATSPPPVAPSSQINPTQSLSTKPAMRDSTNTAVSPPPMAIKETLPTSATTSPTVDATPVAARAASQAVHAQLAEARTQNAQLRALLDTVEKERDFYFAKLRAIEIWCDQRQTMPVQSADDVAMKRLLSNVQAILYKPDA